jgi:hypothetical protein
MFGNTDNWGPWPKETLEEKLNRTSKEENAQLLSGLARLRECPRKFGPTVLLHSIQTLLLAIWQA